MSKQSKPPLGSGERFRELSDKIAHSNPSVKDPDAVAAAIGRKKYGNEKLSNLAQRGRSSKGS